MGKVGTLDGTFFPLFLFLKQLYFLKKTYMLIVHKLRNIEKFKDDSKTCTAQK